MSVYLNKDTSFDNLCVACHLTPSLTGRRLVMWLVPSLTLSTLSTVMAPIVHVVSMVGGTVFTDRSNSSICWLDVTFVEVLSVMLFPGAWLICLCDCSPNIPGSMNNSFTLHMLKSSSSAIGKSVCSVDQMLFLIIPLHVIYISWKGQIMQTHLPGFIFSSHFLSNHEQTLTSCSMLSMPLYQILLLPNSLKSPSGLIFLLFDHLWVSN